MGEHLSTCGRLIAFGAVCLLGARGAEAAPPAPPPTDGGAQATVSIVFDMSMLGSQDAERLQPEITEQLKPVLEQGRMRVVGGTEVGELTLRVSVVVFDEKRRNYEVELTLSGTDGSAMVPVRCDACTERKLIGMLAEDLSQLLEMHEAKPDKVETAPEPPACELVAEAQPAPRRPVRLIGPTGITGATMLGVGIIALAAGGYLLGRHLDEDAARRRWHTSYFPVAAPALAAGAVVAGVGATLLGVDLERNRKRYFAIPMMPTYVGVQINQRF